MYTIYRETMSINVSSWPWYCFTFQMLTNNSLCYIKYTLSYGRLYYIWLINHTLLHSEYLQQWLYRRIYNALMQFFSIISCVDFDLQFLLSFVLMNIVFFCLTGRYLIVFMPWQYFTQRKIVLNDHQNSHFSAILLCVIWKNH